MHGFLNLLFLTLLCVNYEYRSTNIFLRQAVSLTPLWGPTIVLVSNEFLSSFVMNPIQTCSVTQMETIDKLPLFPDFDRSWLCVKQQSLMYLFFCRVMLPTRFHILISHCTSPCKLRTVMYHHPCSLDACMVDRLLYIHPLIRRLLSRDRRLECGAESKV